MDCPNCHTNNPPTAERCGKCNTPLSANASTLLATMTPPGNVSPSHATRVPRAMPPATTPTGTPPAGDAMIVPQGSSGNETMADTPGVAPGWSQPLSTQAGIVVAGSVSGLRPGSTLGNRYEILDLLGEGGMGAVYKARDREVDRLVALKVIRPELAGRPEILQRFKQELILARKVTHRNVIRIFDLGEAEGVKFITMEFIEGHDLKSLLRQKGKLPAEQAVNVMQQACLALEAAHSEGVVHRDLKPQNIMLDAQGKASVMDFGIARSLEPGGMTQTGALVGTPEYMSPEQVRGEHPDGRADLFTLGIIFYELLSGQMPFQADTAMGTMFKRTKERAVPLEQLDRSVPRYLSDIVAKCLEIDPKERYQSARQIYDALEAWKSGAAAPIRIRSLRWVRKALRNRVAVASAAAVVVLAATAFVFRDRMPFQRPALGTPPVEVRSVAVLPFRNASGDASLDWLGSTLAAMLTTDIGQSSHLRTVPSDRVDQILHDLRIAPSSNLDPATLNRVAEFSNADTLISGQFTKLADRIRLDVTLRDPKRPMPVALKAEAPNEKEILGAVSQLAKSVQRNLALPTDVLEELRAKASKPSSQSLPALRFYIEGLQLARQANNAEAAKRFESAIQADPNFALAHARLALTYSRLGGQENEDRAAQEARQAMSLGGNLPPEEQYRIQAAYAQVSGDRQKAIEAYENLAKAFPADADVHFVLGGLYESSAGFDQARDQYARVLQLDPKYLDALLASGRVRIKSGNPQPALDDLNHALNLAVELGNDQEKADILHAMGVAYRQLNKLDDALRNYQDSVDIKRRLGDKRGMALSLNEIAKVQQRLGKREAALTGFNEALQVRREIGDKKGISDTLLDLGVLRDAIGQSNEALKLYKEALQIKRDLGDEATQATLLNNIGGVYLDRAQFNDALVYYQNALQIREKLKVPSQIAETLYSLGETYRSLGQYNQALDHYLRALELFRNAGDKLRAAITSEATGSVFADRGRYGAALASDQDAVKTIREVQESGFWMVEIVSSYGNSLSQVGRFEEAEKSLNEALQQARQLQNKALIAQVLALQGDSFFYRDDLKAAAGLYQQALATASATTDHRTLLSSRRRLVRVDLEQGRAQSALGSLKNLTREADALGMKYLSTECSLDLSEALIETKQYASARTVIERALRTSEKLGLQTLQARGHHLLARTLQLTGKSAEAAREQAEAQRIVAEIYKEANTDTIRKRKDLEALTSTAQ